MLNMSSWSHEKIIAFITEVHSRPELWDVTDNAYKDRDAKKDSWTEAAEKFHISADEAYKKFKNLRTYAKNEEKRKNRLGKPVTWFAYDALSFVLDRDVQDDDDGRESASGSKEMGRHQIDPLDFNETDEAWNSEESSGSAAVAVAKSRKKTPNRTHEPSYKRSQHTDRTTSSAFGEHIVNKLNSYDSYTRAQVEFKISKILFEADMGLLACRAASPHETKYGLQTDM